MDRITSSSTNARTILTPTNMKEMKTVSLEQTISGRRLTIGSYFVDLNESQYQELVRIFSASQTQVSDAEIEAIAIREIPYDESAGNVEDDIDHAKRQLLIRGMKLMCSQLTREGDGVKEEPDPRDNPLTDDDDWIHDVDMGAR